MNSFLVLAKRTSRTNVNLKSFSCAALFKVNQRSLLEIEDKLSG